MLVNRSLYSHLKLFYYLAITQCTQIVLTCIFVPDQSLLTTTHQQLYSNRTVKPVHMIQRNK